MVIYGVDGHYCVLSKWCTKARKVSQVFYEFRKFSGYIKPHKKIKNKKKQEFKLSPPY